MRDCIELSCVPCDEPCQAVGMPSYDPQKVREECNRYKAMLERRFPTDSAGYFRVKSFAHDFGSYMEVVAVFDDTDEAAVEWAFWCEGNLPATWDDDTILPVKHKPEQTICQACNAPYSPVMGCDCNG